MLLAQVSTSSNDIVGEVTAWVVLAIISALAIAVLWYIFTGKIDLSDLISEKVGSNSASMSRFQFLIFTFVIAASLFLIIATDRKFPDVPQGVLVLLGISGSSYVVSKGIQQSGAGTSAAKPNGQ
jgi:hypothetical protein